MFKKFSLNVSENVSSYYFILEKKYNSFASFLTGTMKLTISHFNVSILALLD